MAGFKINQINPYARYWGFALASYHALRIQNTPFGTTKLRRNAGGDKGPFVVDESPPPPPTSRHHPFPFVQLKIVNPKRLPFATRATGLGEFPEFRPVRYLQVLGNQLYGPLGSIDVLTDSTAAFNGCAYIYIYIVQGFRSNDCASVALAAHSPFLIRLTWQPAATCTLKKPVAGCTLRAWMALKGTTSKKTRVWELNTRLLPKDGIPQICLYAAPRRTGVPFHGNNQFRGT